MDGNNNNNFYNVVSLQINTALPKFYKLIYQEYIKQYCRFDASLIEQFNKREILVETT